MKRINLILVNVLGAILNESLLFVLHDESKGMKSKNDPTYIFPKLSANTEVKLI